MKKKNGNQVRWTIPIGTGPEAEETLDRWLKAAVMTYEDSKLFNVWIRRTLNAEADRVLSKKSKFVTLKP